MNNYSHLQLSFDQILDLIKHLPKKEKQLLSKELGKELTNNWLTDLFRTYTMKDLDSEIV